MTIDEIKQPREMKRWGVDGVPEKSGWYWIIIEGENNPMLRELEITEVWSGKTGHNLAIVNITHWLELEQAPTLHE